MNDERLAKRVGEWLATLERPFTVELRARDEVIDVWEVLPDTDAMNVALELVETSAEDAAEEGKTRSYRIMAIQENNWRFPCPTGIRRRIGTSSSEIVGNLTKMVTDLHETLRKDKRESHDMMLAFAKALSADRDAVAHENIKHREHANEVFDKLENLRSKALERDIMKEEHEKDIEVKDRLMGAGIPLLMAIGHRLTKGALPAPDISTTAIVQIIQSLEPSQVDLMREIVGPEKRDALDDILAKGVEGHADYKTFKTYLESLTGHQLLALTQCLNMGQQAAIKEIMNDSGSN